jgi:tRNA-2-methylthio-N6-dimethylallyladenosine synthase
MINSIQRVLVEGNSKKSDQHHFGKTDNNKIVVFEKGAEKIGSYVDVQITACTTGTLLGHLI